jgi:hypothetical protein
MAETAKIFGFPHTCEGAKEVFSEILKRLVRDKKIVSKDDIVTAA